MEDPHFDLENDGIKISQLTNMFFFFLLTRKMIGTNMRGDRRRELAYQVIKRDKEKTATYT